MVIYAICLLLPSDFKQFKNKPCSSKPVLALMRKLLPFQGLCLCVLKAWSLGKEMGLKEMSFISFSGSRWQVCSSVPAGNDILLDD